MTKKKDTSQKILESYNDVFADIANVFLFDGERIILENELEDAQPFSAYKALGKLKFQERDVAKFWNRGNVKIALVGIENQSAIDSTMPLRILGYDGAAYRAELTKRKGKQNLYPVVTLVLYFGKTPWMRGRSLFECVDIPEKLKPFVNDYKINICEIARITKEKAAKFKSDFRIVAEFFASINAGEKWRGSAEDLVHIAEVLELLSAFTPQENADEFWDLVEQGGNQMKGILERHYDKLIQQGRQEGLQFARKNTLDSAKYLFSTGVSEAQIRTAFHLTDDEMAFVLGKSQE